MINLKNLSAAVCALTAALTIAPTSSTPAPSAPALAGPGGVYYAVQDFLGALDTADADALGSAMTSLGHPVEFTMGDDGQLATTQEAAGLNFWGLTATGENVSANSHEGLCKIAASLEDKELGRCKTTITSLRAECSSERLSYALVEFDRVWGYGKGRRVTPMRATALLRYNSDKQGNNFEILSWHGATR